VSEDGKAGRRRSVVFIIMKEWPAVNEVPREEPMSAAPLPADALRMSRPWLRGLAAAAKLRARGVSEAGSRTSSCALLPAIDLEDDAAPSEALNALTGR
jgi:hypothetical protein